MFVHIVNTPNDPIKRFAAVDACIYCQRTRAQGIQLTEEHIIPDGLGGNLVLPRASCVDCAAKINVYETRVQRTFFDMARLANRIRSKKRRGKKYKPQSTYKVYEGVRFDWNAGNKGVKNPFKRVPITPDMPNAILYEYYNSRPGLLTGLLEANKGLNYGLAFPDRGHRKVNGRGQTLMGHWIFFG